MYKIGICDNGRNACASIENMLLQYASEKAVPTEVQIRYTGELLRMTGIELGHYIRGHLDDMGMQIVYISGRPSYARQLFKTQPLDFLVKPILQE